MWMRDASTSSSSSATDDAPVAPAGKRALTQRLAASGTREVPVAAPPQEALGAVQRQALARDLREALGQFEPSSVQRRAEGLSGLQPAEVQAHAARGRRGGGQVLPYLDVLERAFAPHQLGTVRAHFGGEAQAASEAIGARAYTRGEDVVFAESSPSLWLVAHEVAHVVQQRAGVALTGGVGQAGDGYEQQADAVAEAVVRGEPAAELLGQATPQAHALGAEAEVQCAPGTKKAKKPAAPKPPAVKAAVPLIGCDAYVACDAVGFTETGEPLQIAGQQWGVVVDQLVDVKTKKGEGPYEATSRVLVRLADGTQLWLAIGEVQVAPAGLAQDASLDRERGDHAQLAARFNREFANALTAFDGGLTSESAAELFSAEQREALWSFLATKIVPEGLFTSMPLGKATVPQRTLVAAHILSVGKYVRQGELPDEQQLRRAQADFCYHWVQFVWNYAGINEGKGGNAAYRGVVGPTGKISFGAGAQLLSDEAGNPLGQQPVAPAGTLGYFGENAKNEQRSARRESLGEAELADMLRPGDWIWIYNGNASAGGGHSVVFAGWTSGERGKAIDQPVFLPPHALEPGATEEHDGELEEVRFAWAMAYSQQNNSPKTEAEQGGHAHPMKLGPYFYRQAMPDGKGKHTITPVYCVTRPDPESSRPDAREELLQYKRSSALEANLGWLKAHGLELEAVRAHLAKACRELRRQALVTTLDEEQSQLADELIESDEATIEAVTDLAALVQRLTLPGKNVKVKINGLLETLRLDPAALGAVGGPKAGAPVDEGRMLALALEANRRAMTKAGLEPEKVVELVRAKVEAAEKAGSKRKVSAAAASANAETLASLEALSPAPGLESLGVEVAKLQVLRAVAPTGWWKDVAAGFTKPQLASAKR